MLRSSGLTLCLVLGAGCGVDGSDRDQLVGGVDAGLADAGGDAGPIDAALAIATDAGASPDAEVAPDAAMPPDADPCAVTGSASLTGTTYNRYEGSGGYDQTSADVVWQLVETVGCVDHYQSTGTAHWDWYGGSCTRLVLDPTDHAIGSADGALVIDRSAAPATFVIRGETRWPATITCTIAGDPPFDEVTESVGGGLWIEASGAVVGGRIDGTLDEGNRESMWSFGPTA